jgi:hypothetical protein
MPGNFDMERDRGVRTRQQFITRFADKDTLVIGSHFAEPTAGHIVRDGDAWKLVIEA